MKTITTIIHRAETRGYADHGWLKSYHTFSFAAYDNPERRHFGLLRVLNDDQVAPGMGFGTHAHDNMEIITIPLAGALEHKDSTGRHKIINTNEVQIMSAGTGIYHSEYNASELDEVRFLQIWVYPKVKNITPCYDQKEFDREGRLNSLQIVVSPVESEETLFINQDAWFTLSMLEAGNDVNYKVHKPGSGVYFFLIEGNAKVAGTDLKRRDAMGLMDADSFEVKALDYSEALFIEVPMN